jgi:hypothetical protein
MALGREKLDPAGPPPAMPEGAPAGRHWLRKAAAVAYALFCFELGVVLLLLPWVDLWNQNYFARFIAPALWTSPYLRGAVSGLGVVDIGISFLEIVRLRRFAERG